MIAELFTEGVPLFDLSQLLAYRNGQFFPEQVLNKIEDRSIRDLVTMLQVFAIKNLIELCSFFCISSLSKMLHVWNKEPYRLIQMAYCFYFTREKCTIFPPSQTELI